MCTYKISQAFDAIYYKGNPDLIINRMVDMKYEMIEKFGSVYDDELEWHIHISLINTLRNYDSYFSKWCDEECLGVKVIVEDFPIKIISSPQITLVYKKRGDYTMEMDFIWGIKQAIRPRIKKVIFNDPATIVYWDDDTKTVVKCQNESFDSEKGLAMAICKKLMGLKDFYKHYNAAIDDEVKRENK